MSRRHQIKPGWKMTFDQHDAYWWHLGQAAKILKLTTFLQREELREQIHIRAFGSNISAKQIDHLKMFDTFKAEILAITKPDSVGAQLRQANQPLIRLRHRILEFPEAYVRALLNTPRFGYKKSLDALDDMDEQTLIQFRNTLCARNPKPLNEQIPMSVPKLEIRDTLQDEPMEVEEPDPF